MSDLANSAQALAPALVDSIKTAGLVLIADVSDGAPLATAIPPERIDGTLQVNGVLRFNASVDM